jgi:SPW repeat-containing protein
VSEPARPSLLREPVLWAAPIVVATLVAPFLLGYDSVPVLGNHVSYTLAVAPLALVAAGLAPAAALTALAGVWLAASPFVLGYADEGVEAWAIDLVAGLAVAALGAASARPLRRRTVEQLEALQPPAGPPPS